jgi:hypothetical protein
MREASSRSCRRNGEAASQTAASPPASRTSSATHSSASRVAVQREPDESVPDLDDPEPFQLPPQRDPGRRRLPRKTVDEKNPPPAMAGPLIYTHSLSVTVVSELRRRYSSARAMSKAAVKPATARATGTHAHESADAW